MSSISCLNQKSPNATRRATNENDSVRISTLATLVEVTTRPAHCDPLGIDVSFIQSARMRGGAAGADISGVGQGLGAIVTAAASSTPAGETCVHADAASAIETARMANNAFTHGRIIVAN